VKEIYLDNSATTKVLPEAAEKAAMLMLECYGNPSSLHSKGTEAERELKKAREAVAARLSAQAEELYFTSGGTEANNLAVLSAAAKRRGGRIVTTAIEHSSVLEAVKSLEKQGCEAVYLKPDAWGRISEKDILEAVDSSTVFVSIMAVNNEVGTIQPWEYAAKAIKLKKAPALLHVDAVQAFCKLPLNPAKFGVDLMSVSAHKIHGAKGVGALYVRKGLHLASRTFGGGQEKNLRTGTEAVPLIGAFGVAAAKAEDNKSLFTELNLHTREALKEFEEVIINSPEDALPCIINFSVVGIRSETMLHHLASQGVYVSSGSACAKGKPSHVLEAMALPRERADSALRISFSKYNSKEDIAALISGIKSGLNTIARSKV
jgi:cysteine desulfurase